MTHSEAFNRIKVRKSGCNVFFVEIGSLVVYACNNYIFSGNA